MTLPARLRARIAALLKSAVGAFDLPSIIVGTVVVAILAAGVFAAVFGVIPWSQDEQTKQDLSAARTAEGTAYSKDGGFRDADGLAALTYLPRVERLDVGASEDGECYLAVGKSVTGNIYYSSHLENEPTIMNPSSRAGCLTPGSIQDIVDEVGGWDPGVYKPIGDGTGTTTDPGEGVVFDDTGNAESADSPVEVTSLTVIDRVIRIEMYNASDDPKTAAYALDVTCASTTTGVVTVETITGTFDLNGKIVSGVNIDACAKGSVPVAAAAHAPYDKIETYDAMVVPIAVRKQVVWRTNYVYYQATPVVRGALASSEFCIDDKDFSAADGNPIILNTCNGSDAQRWQWDGNGPIRQSALLDKCLSVPNTASTAPQSLVLGTCNHSTGQNFSIAPHSDGKVQMVQSGSGLCIDIQGGAKTAGAPLITAACNGSLSQSWKLPAGANYLVPGAVPNAPVPPSEGGPQLAPGTPTSVAFSKYSGSEVYLTWAPVSGATAFLLEATGTSTTYGANRQPIVTEVNASATITPGTATSGGIRIPAGSDGQITVKALNGGASSPASAPVPFSTPNNSVVAAGSTGTDFTFAKAPTVGSNGTPADIGSTPRGTTLASPNGRYFAVFQSDNNFVIYDKDINHATYTSNTFTTATTRLTFQKDGNLVAYSSTNSAVKSTGTWAIAKPAILVMQNDGNLVIYDASVVAKWASKTTSNFMVRAPGW